MTWLPLGPDFTFAPNDASFLRLSRRNEIGAQAMVDVIAIDPTSAKIIYVIQNPWTGGYGAFRTDDGGSSWSSIVDDIGPTRPASSSPSAITINPATPSTIYMGWSDGAFFVSSDYGKPGSWLQLGTVSSDAIFQIIVDPATAASPNPLLYVACSAEFLNPNGSAVGGGVYVSTTGGASWIATTLTGANITSFVADFAGSNFYVGVEYSGLYYCNDPLTEPWTNLNAGNIGLPPFGGSAGAFYTVLVGFCVQNPNRVYVWLTNPDQSTLYTTSTPPNGWTAVSNAMNLPAPTQGLYCEVMAICPNSPGDGQTDILLFGNTLMYRSIDAGQTWQAASGTNPLPLILHADQHAIAFAPQVNSSVPAVYLGCDGGLGMSTSLADPNFSLSAPVGSDNETATYTSTSPVVQNLDHGMMASALLAHAAHIKMPAVNYMACGDTGMSGSTGALGWRSLAIQDAYAVVASPGPSGVSLWTSSGFYLNDGWPYNQRIGVTTDSGAYSNSGSTVTLNGSNLENTSHNFTLDQNGLCLTGALYRVPVETLTKAVPGAGQATVSASSMQDITLGAMLVIDPGDDEEVVQVTQVTATTFTATFKYQHSVGIAIQYEPSVVARIDRAGNVTQLSRDFQNFEPTTIAIDYSSPNILYCAVSSVNTNQSFLYQTTNGINANASTVWTQVSANAPASISAANTISSIAIDPSGNVYVLLTQPDPASHTPLYQINGNSWSPVASANLPNGANFGAMAADSLQAGVLYVGVDASVYAVTISGTATWQSITGNLPGGLVYSLWAGNIGGAGSIGGRGTKPLALLRAGIACRGIYELDITAGAQDESLALYMRANIMDVSWLPTVPDGVANPYDPAELLYHYQSADIKIDPQQSVGNQTFYTTDPENPVPISHVAFNELSENASNLPQQTLARVHVQVNNRSITPSGDVWVWVIYCGGAAGVAALNLSASHNNNFPFWSQFGANGTITPALPNDSPWQSVGAPFKVTAIDALHPQIASWTWTIPAAQFGNHHCMVAFVNAAGALLSSMQSYDVDAIAVQNRQVSQKNLFLAGPVPPGMHKHTPMPIRFNNPTNGRRIAVLEFDLRTLDKGFEFLVVIPKREFHFVGGQNHFIEEVVMGPYESLQSIIEMVQNPPLAPGSQHRFHVRQVVNDRVVGGAVVIIPAEGRAKSQPIRRQPDDESTGGPPRLAPWISPHVLNRGRFS